MSNVREDICSVLGPTKNVKKCYYNGSFLTDIKQKKMA